MFLYKIWNCYFKLKVNLKHSGSISRSTYLEYVNFDHWEGTSLYNNKLYQTGSKSLIKNRPRTQFNPFWTHVRSSDLEETQLTLEHEIWMARDKSRRTWFLRKFQIDMSGSSWWAIKRYKLGHENPLNLVLAICEFLTSHTCHSHISHIYYRTCSFMVWLIINYAGFLYVVHRQVFTNG